MRSMLNDLWGSTDTHPSKLKINFKKPLKPNRLILKKWLYTKNIDHLNYYFQKMFNNIFLK